MLKKLLIALLVLIVVAVAAALLLLRNADAIVARVIEDVGTRATQAPVSVESVDLRVTDGRGTITGLTIGNPKGFEAPNAFVFGTTTLEMKPEALTRRPVVVERVTIDRCDVTYEWQRGGSNIARIQENVHAFVRELQGESGPGDDGGVVISELVIEGGHIEVQAPFLGGRVVGAELERIVLRDIGRRDGGASAGEIAAVVLAALTRGVLAAVADLGIDGLGEVVKAGKGLLDAARDLFK